MPPKRSKQNADSSAVREKKLRADQNAKKVANKMAAQQSNTADLRALLQSTLQKLGDSMDPSGYAYVDVGDGSNIDPDESQDPLGSSFVNSQHLHPNEESLSVNANQGGQEESLFLDGLSVDYGKDAEMDAETHPKLVADAQHTAESTNLVVQKLSVAELREMLQAAIQHEEKSAVEATQTFSQDQRPIASVTNATSIGECDAKTLPSKTEKSFLNAPHAVFNAQGQHATSHAKVSQHVNLDHCETAVPSKIPYHTATSAQGHYTTVHAKDSQLVGFNHGGISGSSNAPCHIATATQEHHVPSLVSQHVDLGHCESAVPSNTPRHIVKAAQGHHTAAIAKNTQHVGFNHGGIPGPSNTPCHVAAAAQEHHVPSLVIDSQHVDLDRGDGVVPKVEIHNLQIPILAEIQLPTTSQQHNSIFEDSQIMELEAEENSQVAGDWENRYKRLEHKHQELVKKHKKLKQKCSDLESEKQTADNYALRTGKELMQIKDQKKIPQTRFTTLDEMDITVEELESYNERADTDSMFAGLLATKLVGSDTLAKMSVTGQASHRYSKEKNPDGSPKYPALERMDPEILKFICNKVAERAAIKVGVENIATIRKRSDTFLVKRYIGQKIANLRKAVVVRKSRAGADSGSNGNIAP